MEGEQGYSQTPDTLEFHKKSEITLEIGVSSEQEKATVKHQISASLKIDQTETKEIDVSSKIVQTGDWCQFRNCLNRNQTRDWCQFSFGPNRNQTGVWCQIGFCPNRNQTGEQSSRQIPFLLPNRTYIGYPSVLLAKPEREQLETV